MTDELRERLIQALQERASYIDWSGVVDFVLAEIGRTHDLVPKDWNISTGTGKGGFYDA